MDLTEWGARPPRGREERPGGERRAAPRRRAAAHRRGAEERARRGASLVVAADDRGAERIQPSLGEEEASEKGEQSLDGLQAGPCW